MDPCGECYLDVRRLIDSRVHAFYRHYGGSLVTKACGRWEEVRAAADEFYVNAYLSFVPDQGTKFGTWVAYKVWRGLQDLLEKGLKSRLAFCDPGTLEWVPYREKKFDLAEFTAGMSKQARQVISLTLHDTPKDVKRRMRRRGLNTPAAFRCALRNHLRDLGWSAAEVTKSFLEIRKALTM